MYLHRVACGQAYRRVDNAANMPNAWTSPARGSDIKIERISVPSIVRVGLMPIFIGIISPR